MADSTRARAESKGERRRCRQERLSERAQPPWRTGLLASGFALSSEAGTILIIEDDPDTRANICDILELDGYVAVTASTFAEALNRTDWDRIVAVLMDRRLPDGNAETMLPHFRSLAPATPIVVVTGFPDVDGAIVALREGPTTIWSSPSIQTLCAPA